MKKFDQISTLAMLAVAFIFGLSGPIAANAATSPSLGAAASYGILSSTYTNTVSGTTVNGDVGFTTGPAVAPFGTHANYGSGAPYSTAGTDQGSALVDLNSQSCTFNFAPGAIDLATDTTHGPIGIYTPGVYCTTGAASIGTAGITLSGSGTYIFRIDGALTTVVNSVVTLAGASACDVFWTPTEATTLGAESTFAGTVIDAAGITLGADNVTSHVWLGRALAFGGTVTTSVDNIITVPTCTAAPATLHIIKTVINDNSGTATASSFNLHVEFSGADVAGSPAVGIVSPGRSYTLSAGTYAVSEDADSSYTQSFSGDCDANGSVTLSAGSAKTCTITNNDIATVSLPASIKVVKTVINDNGGNKTVADFPLFVNGTSVVSGMTNVFSASNSYAVTETSDSGYTRTFSGDCDISGKLSLVAGDNKLCTITNNDIAAVAISPATVGSTPPIVIPSLPNAGFASEEKSVPSNIIILYGVFMIISVIIVSALRKRKI